MNILITHSTHDKHASYFEATIDRVSGFVVVYNDDGPMRGNLQACCQNSSHRVWRKSGRHFHTAAEALEHYRSPEMRAIVQAAIDFAAESEAA